MIRGWCPTVHRPMPSGDGLLARVKPPGGRLPAAAVRALAKAAACYGNGIVELTSRGNLQVRGVHNPAAFAQAMVAAKLADPDPLREQRRNVVIVPPCDDALVAAVEAMMAATPDLPEKLCVLVMGRELWVGDRLFDGLSALRRFLADAPSNLLPLPLAGEGRGEGRGRSEGLAHLLYLPLGQTTAAQLATLTTAVRTTPWRAFLSPVPVPGFATQPSTVTACAGAPACASGTVPAKADAARLQAMGLARIHVSGCDKGCGRPRGGATLIGRDGHYDLIRRGQTLATGLTLDQAAAAL